MISLAMEAQLAADLARELPRRVTAFFAGDELYAGAWLTKFQRTEGAWDVCVEALRPGPLPTCDDELLQEFSAQTLARLSRAFTSRHAPEARRKKADELTRLLLQHASGQRVVWRQLALAMTCANLWLGRWAPPAAGSLKEEVRRELLALPAELLFCDRALPLSDPQLRQAAAKAMLDHCDMAFAGLLVADEQGNVRSAALAAWLRVLRKALALCPTHDTGAPLRALMALQPKLLELARELPSEAIEVVQQLARWRQEGCDAELAALLGSLLECLFSSVLDEESQVLLPLLADLASNYWPRATLGDFALDHQAIAVQALTTLQAAVGKEIESGDPDADDPDVEAAFAVWETFVVTLRDGTRASLQGAEASLVADFPSCKTSGAVGGAICPRDVGVQFRPEKRSRVAEVGHWHAPPERIAKCEALPGLLGHIMQGLLELLKVPTDPVDVSLLLALRKVRAVAQTMIAAWTALVGDGSGWQEAMWAPLQQLGTHLEGFGAGELSGDACSEAEVVLWFSATLARNLPKGASAPPLAEAMLRLRPTLDAAPEMWRGMLRIPTFAMAAASSPEQLQPLQQVVEWALSCPPAGVDPLELLELLELPYTEALEQLCRQLPPGPAYVAVGGELAKLAFAERPPLAEHGDWPQAQALLLRAMRHAMGGDAALLCQGLSQEVLPRLRLKVEQEAEQALGKGDPPWNEAQAFFATLAAVLPKSGAAVMDPGHPAVALWGQQWPLLEAALLRWEASAETDQPAQAAAEALAEAALALPALLPQALRLLVQSAEQQELPLVQLRALREVITKAPCPPLDPANAAELFSAALAQTVERLLTRDTSVHAALLHSPPTLAAAFLLLADAVRPSPAGVSGAGLCSDRLRPAMLAKPELLGKCLQLVVAALPECTSAQAAGAMLRFVGRLAGGEDSDPSGIYEPLLAQLPALCVTFCKAFASQEHFTEPDHSLSGAAEFLLRVANELPTMTTGPLAEGLRQAEVPAWSGGQLQLHIANRSAWKAEEQADWLEQLRCIVCEWQREYRKVIL